MPDTPTTPFQNSEGTDNGLGPLNDPGAHAPPQDVDYDLLRMIGRGGYGEVWLVRDKAGSYYACKVVYRESFQHDRPYEREYEGICKFEPVSRASESQIKILHVGRRDALGYFYYIMEVADDARAGREIHPEHYNPRTLFSDLQEHKKLPGKDCLKIGLALSEALENLHTHGLIHRDIKPGNIIFVNGVPKLADIGLVTDLDVTISYVGTEGYIPPEGPTSPQADIYSLGKVLYEMSTGKDRLQYPELPDNFSEIPDWEFLLELNAIVAKACETNPARRYATAEELHNDLALLKRGKSIRKQRAMQRRQRLLARVAGIVALIALMASGVVYGWKHQFFRAPVTQIKIVSDKISAPEAVRLAQCEAKIKSDYQDRLASGNIARKQDVSAELYNQSLAESDTAMELASLQVAAQLAMEAGDFSRAMQICGRMDDRFQINILPIKTGLLAEGGLYARAARNNTELTEVCLQTGFQAIAADDYTNADTIAALAQVAAQKADDKHLGWQVGFLTDEAAQCAEAFARVKPFAQILRDKPDDAAANLTMGKFVCFVKNDWAKGLSMLARGNDAGLQSLAAKEMGGTAKNPPEQIALGDAWWNLSTKAAADEKVSYEQRARYWYLKALTATKEPDKNSVRAKLMDRINAVPTQSAQIHIASRIGGQEFVDIYSDRAEWRSGQRGASGNKINYVSVDDFDASDLQIIQNSGSTWLMPNAVDFSTAHLDSDARASDNNTRQPKRRDRERLTVFDDHVRVVLAHPRTGAAALDVTVIFGSQP